MKILSLVLLSCSLLNVSFVLGQEALKQQQCACRDCKCTAQAHCGCYSNKGCNCHAKCSCSSNKLCSDR